MFKSVSNSLLWKGVLAIAIGLVSVAWPGITVGAFVLLFAVYAFVNATADGVRAFTSRQAGPVLGYLVLSLLSAAAGAIALAWPGITAVVLTLFVSGWAFVTGAIQVALAFGRGEAAGERAWWMLGGLVSMALGVVLSIRPDAGALTLATVFGLFSIVSGIGALTLSTRLRRAPAAAQSVVGPTPQRSLSRA
jgi:uncharacterized membrane protein HdeD (DUF308 family)